MRVYLAGPIQHAADYGKGWRARLKSGEIAETDGIEFVDPMDKYNTKEQEYTEWTDTDIIREDLALIAECDAILVHWPAYRSERPYNISSQDSRLCDSCGSEYVQIQKHWQMSSCTEPTPTDRELEVVRGLVMSDGHIGNRVGTPRLDVQMTNPDVLEELRESIPTFKPYFWKESKETSSGNDVYRLLTVSHSSLSEFSDWYDNGDKIYPDNMTPTPEMMKWWYVGDGSMIWNEKASNGYVQISCCNESNNPEKLSDLFDKIGLSPTIYNGGEIALSVNETKKFLEYIGEPVRGMEYKWEGGDMKSYERMKPNAPVTTTGTPMEVFFSSWTPEMMSAMRGLAEDAVSRSGTTKVNEEILLREAMSGAGLPGWYIETMLALESDIQIVVQTTVPVEELSPWLTGHADAIVSTFDDAIAFLEGEDVESLDDEYTVTV